MLGGRYARDQNGEAVNRNVSTPCVGTRLFGYALALRLEHREPVAPLALGPVHGGIGGGHRLEPARVVERGERDDSDARGQLERAVVRLELVLADHLEQL